MPSYRILPWRVDDGGMVTEYHVLRHNGEGKIEDVNLSYDKEAAELYIRTAQANEKLNSIPQTNGYRSFYDFREGVERMFGLDLRAHLYLRGNEGRVHTPLPGDSDLWLTATWYNGKVEVAYIS